ncbi:MAG TPA: ATP-binding protein [Longimicrobiales bacterium]
MNRRSPIRADDSAATVPLESLQRRELEIVREVAHAFLTATQPLEVYRLALARVTPLVEARFSSVFLRDSADHDLLRLVCAQNWPQSSARFLSQLRIRVGRGPTGRAVALGEAVAVEDVFADPAFREWWGPARELGFVSLITLPLEVHGEVAGALSFYFDAPHVYGEEEQRLLALVAAQIAATAERAHLIEDLRDANERLRRQNEELTRRVAEAEEARRLKNEFLANVSHELRTPLTAVLGYTYLLSAGLAGPITDEQRAALSKIDHSAGLLLRLITDLLELSDLKLGRATIAESTEEAVELAQRAAERVGPAPDGITFRVLSADGRLAIRTDPAKVLKILENLISNAFKFTASGEVTVTVRRKEARQPRAAASAQWVVQDTGIGIRPEDIAGIFDEFRQVDGSSTRLYGGTGLGLALSLRLAHLLGGEIHVESEPGRGSTFTLELPLEREPPPTK